MSGKELLLTHSRNGAEVWYDPQLSHAATHIADTPELKSLASEVISQSDIEGDYMLFHTDMGKTVGKSDLVETKPGDTIVYAKRLNRKEFTVFNKSRKPEPSSLVTVAVKRRGDGSYELASTWVGPSDLPSFPGTERETPDSKKFWAQHSLAWGKQEVQPGTETTVCPW